MKLRRVLLIDKLAEVAEMMDASVIDYLAQRRTETFEGFENYYLMAFDWYDVTTSDNETTKVLIYLDREDLFCFCEDERGLAAMKKCVPTADAEGAANDHMLYLFFLSMLRRDTEYMDTLESDITDEEDIALTRSGRDDYMDSIVVYRRELLRRKRYYEQLAAIFESLKNDDEKLLSRDTRRHFSILENRVDRLRSTVLNLRDYVTQMREAYQSAIDLQQNELMRFFTVITAVFLPLTLLVGWYGMNFKYMPELSWRYGYLGIILVSVGICVALIIQFRRKHWF